METPVTVAQNFKKYKYSKVKALTFPQRYRGAAGF